MKQNLLIVTEHYPCGTQESFLENEIQELKKLYKVHVISLDTERLMSQSLPKDVVFYRPAEKVSGLKRFLTRLSCRFSRGYKEETAIAKEEGRLTPVYQKRLLASLVKSRLLYDYIRSQDLFEREEPLLIYSANFNDYLYGLCCLKDFSDDIRVVARCHNANMFNPRTGARRETLNGVINRRVDAVYFTSEHSRQLYLDNFVQTGEDVSRFRVARLGVPGQEREQLDPLPEFFLRVVTCSPTEKDKRLKLLVDALARVQGGCIEWVHIGDGSEQQELVSYAKSVLAEKKGIRCRFLGKLTRREIYRYYRETYIDMFLSVSISESVPTAMMEAMANHIFVAATNVDGVSAVVDNDNGMLLPANVTAEQLGLALDGFCRISKERIAQKGERAYQSWKENFDAEKNCRLFAEQLARLSGQTEGEIAGERAEAEHKPEGKDAPEPLSMPAARANIREMPVSFRESLEADGLIIEEKTPGKARRQTPEEPAPARTAEPPRPVSEPAPETETVEAAGLIEQLKKLEQTGELGPLEELEQQGTEAPAETPRN